jgi:hypothetical protein
MDRITRKFVAAIGAALALGFGAAGASRADDAPAPRVGPHGGTLQATRRHQFETLLSPAGVKVYPYGLDGKPLNAAKLAGKATFYYPGSPQPWFDRPLAAAGPGGTAESLDRAINLSRVPAQGVRVAFEVGGLPDPAEPTASFGVPFTVTAPPAPPPASTPAAITVAKATRGDQAAVNAQRVCAVSGEPLGSMGTPVKVSRGDRSVFLCCQGCLRGVRANPDRYLGAAR